MADPKVILVLGAGRSSSSLIAHLLGQAEQEQWRIQVGDLNLAAAQAKVNGHACGEAFVLSDSDHNERNARIAGTSLKWPSKLGCTSSLRVTFLRK